MEMIRDVLLVLGGGGVVAVAFLKWGGSVLARTIEQRYGAALQRQLETYKAELAAVSAKDLETYKAELFRHSQTELEQLRHENTKELERVRTQLIERDLSARVETARQQQMTEVVKKRIESYPALYRIISRYGRSRPIHASRR